MPINDYSVLPKLLAQTLPKYLGRPGEEGGVINEAAVQYVLFGRLLEKIKPMETDGTSIKWPLQFDTADLVFPVGPLQRLNPGTTPATVFGNMPFRWFGWSKLLDHIELKKNNAGKSSKQTLVDISKQCKNDLIHAIIRYLETYGLKRSGNYESDGQYSSVDHFQNPLYWLTIDGLHITGDTSKTVGGINPNTRTTWKNPFINPVTASDGLGPINSMFDLREAFDRMFMMLGWDALDFLPAGIGKPADAPSVDYDNKQTPRDLMIWTDNAGSIQLRRVLFDREDGVSADQHRARPVYHGVEIMNSPSLGTGPSGYGFDHSGNALWTDRGGSYASGNWPNRSEFLFINRKYLKLVGGKPDIRTPYQPDHMFATVFEGMMELQTLMVSRQRGGGYIGPVPRDAA